VEHARRESVESGKTSRHVCLFTKGINAFCRFRPAVDLPSRPMSAKREAYELLLIEEADAWFEYLEATRGQSPLRYKEIEPWAWARLMQRLRAIKARRARLRPAAA
jgi:hypothetical protein